MQNVNKSRKLFIKIACRALYRVYRVGSNTYGIQLVGFGIAYTEYTMTVVPEISSKSDHR